LDFSQLATSGEPVRIFHKEILINMRLGQRLLPLAFFSICAFTLQGQQSAMAVPGGDQKAVRLSGHISPAVQTALQNGGDLGRIDKSLPMEHLVLLLKRSPANETAFEKAIADQQDQKSPRYHQWMTADEIGKNYGVSEEEEARVRNWLMDNGFRTESIDSARTTMEFSGNAGQVEVAFKTELHSLRVGSTVHMAATIEPSVPAELSTLIAGVPLSDFKPHPLLRDTRSYQKNAKTGKLIEVSRSAHTSPSLVVDYEGETMQLMTPGDMAIIYDLNPLWKAGYRGAGQTVAVVEDTLMKAADVASFRKVFGLSGYSGTFSQQVPAGSHPCQSPGKNGAESEAALDAEWAGATAPDANVILAGCADTSTQFGGLIAVMNMLSWKTPPQTISISYGSCEAEMGYIQQNQFYTTFQQAAAEGVSIFVSSGDEGAASCDADQEYAQYGIRASGFATTPYNVAVGGTDFYDYAQGTESKYWSTTNSANLSTALSYVPEKTWNNSCADSTVLQLEGYSAAYGTSGLCNNSPGNNWVTTGSGSGAPSSLYGKPSWQSVYGNPSDGLRDIPDVSLFAASGFYGHALVYCDTDKYTDGTPCDFTDSNNAVYNTAGGTSFASPALAGIFTLITQKYGRQGNPNAGFYSLAQGQYGSSSSPNTATLTACDSTLGSKTGSSCIFHDVTQGNIDVPCIGTENCYGYTTLSIGHYTLDYFGALSTSDEQFKSAYPSTKGWDFATGLGTIDAAHLFNAWASESSSSSVKR